MLHLLKGRLVPLLLWLFILACVTVWADSSAIPRSEHPRPASHAVHVADAQW